VFERLGQRRTTLVLLVLVSVTLITFDVRGSGVIDGARSTAGDVFSPVRNVARTVFRPFENTWHGIFDYDDIKRERDRLADQVEAQEGAAIAADAAVREMQALEALDKLPTLANVPQVTGRVISEPASNFDRTVDINQGTSQGVQVGMPVITNGGLVGRVMKVFPDRSTVRLVTDPNFSMAVKIVPGPDHPPPTTTAPPTTVAPAGAATETTVEPTTTVADPNADPNATAPTTTVAPTTTTLSELERGWVTGQGADQDLQVEQIKAESTVQEGDIVSTSGVQESLAPADLPIGRITSVARHAGTGLLEVHVSPSANLANLNFVKVLLYCTECSTRGG
jgi:rod shape-determining protein MreC